MIQSFSGNLVNSIIKMESGGGAGGGGDISIEIIIIIFIKGIVVFIVKMKPNSMKAKNIYIGISILFRALSFFICKFYIKCQIIDNNHNYKSQTVGSVLFCVIFVVKFFFRIKLNAFFYFFEFIF